MALVCLISFSIILAYLEVTLIISEGISISTALFTIPIFMAAFAIGLYCANYVFDRYL